MTGKPLWSLFAYAACWKACRPSTYTGNAGISLAFSPTLVSLSLFSWRMALAQMKMKIPMPMVKGPNIFILSEWRCCSRNRARAPPVCLEGVSTCRTQGGFESFNIRSTSLYTMQWCCVPVKAEGQNFPRTLKRSSCTTPNVTKQLGWPWHSDVSWVSVRVIGPRAVHVLSWGNFFKSSRSIETLTGSTPLLRMAANIALLSSSEVTSYGFAFLTFFQ